MSDNKKYYYLKLKESFFDSDEIVLLENMQDGERYSNLLLKLYLKSLKNDGRLILNEQIPYDAQMIATITGHQIGTVERALQIFIKLGLVDCLIDGVLYMSNIELLIGKSSTEAERKRQARKNLSARNLLCGHSADICPPEKEIEKEIKKELELENAFESDGMKLGRYKNVCLTAWEYETLKSEFAADFNERIEILSEYMASTGKEYQSHIATIRRWAKNGNEKRKQISDRDYSCQEGESL